MISSFVTRVPNAKWFCGFKARPLFFRVSHTCLLNPNRGGRKRAKEKEEKGREGNPRIFFPFRKTSPMRLHRFYHRRCFIAFTRMLAL